MKSKSVSVHVGELEISSQVSKAIPSGAILILSEELVARNSKQSKNKDAWSYLPSTLPKQVNPIPEVGEFASVGLRFSSLKVIGTKLTVQYLQGEPSRTNDLYDDFSESDTYEVQIDAKTGKELSAPKWLSHKARQE